VNKPQYLVQSQGRDIAALLGTDTSEQLLLTQLDDTMNVFYDLQGACERIKNTAFPDEVRFISRALVWAIIISMPVVFLQPERATAPLEMIVVLVINISFLVVDQLGASLKNPFENKPNDTPMSALCRSIEIDLRQQLGETEVPPPLEPSDGVLM
jgi:putative membrane protein